MTREERHDFIVNALTPKEIKESEYLRYIKIDLDALRKEFLHTYMCTGDMIEDEFKDIFIMYVQKHLSMDIGFYAVARQIHMYLDALEKEDGGLWHEHDD